jgi:hypothetical protein
LARKLGKRIQAEDEGEGRAPLGAAALERDLEDGER